MSNYLDVYVRDALKRIPGVAEVFIFGERKYSMRLWLDPVAMAGRALTASDVSNALADKRPGRGGRVGQPPSQLPDGGCQVSVRAVGRLSEPAEFDNIILKTNGDGTLVRLKDVGHAELGAGLSSDLQFNGQDAVRIAVTSYGERARCGPESHCRTRPAVRRVFRQGCITSWRLTRPTR